MLRYGSWTDQAEEAASRSVWLPSTSLIHVLTLAGADLSAGFTYIPPLAGLGQSMDAMAVVPVASALLGPTVGLASAKAVTSHFRYVQSPFVSVSTYDG